MIIYICKGNPAECDIKIRFD